MPGVTGVQDTSAGSALHIGVSGPCSPRAFADDLGVASESLPVGLGGTPVNHLTRAFLDLGLRVSLVTLDRSIQPDQRVHVTGDRLSLYVGPYRESRRARDRFATERAAVCDAIKAAAPTAVSAHWSYEFALGAIQSGVPTLVTVRDVPSEIFKHQPSPYRLVRWMMHRESMTRATSVAFNSEYTRQRLRHPRSRGASVLPNALPDTFWHLDSRDPPDPVNPVFISVNNGFGRRKNVSSLLLAFIEVRRQASGAQLRLIGTGFEPRGPAATWASRHASNEGVEYLGKLEYGATLEALQAADVLVHPALEESFGYTLIEAASVGTPVIAGENSGAVPWVLGNGNQGILVDVRSTQAIAAAMLTIVRDEAAWSELRTRAFHHGRARFSTSVVAKRYVETLQEIGDAGSARPW